MVRILFNEELRLLKKKVAYAKKKAELISQILKKCVDK
jgi:hypothetical protein